MADLPKSSHKSNSDKKVKLIIFVIFFSKSNFFSISKSKLQLKRTEKSIKKSQEPPPNDQVNLFFLLLLLILIFQLFIFQKTLDLPKKQIEGICEHVSIDEDQHERVNKKSKNDKVLEKNNINKKFKIKIK